MKVPPVVAAPHAEAAVFNLNLLSATGTGILVAAIISGFILGYRPAALVRMYGRTIYMIRYSLLTIACMLAFGYHHPLFGHRCDDGPGLRPAGWLYPLFGTLLGWLGVALTGSDTSFERAVRWPAEDHRRAARHQSRVDGGGQQLRRRNGQDDRRAEHRRRLDRDAMVRARGSILRFVFFHSIALAVLVGLLVMAQAYVRPFTAMVPDMPPACGARAAVSAAAATWQWPRRNPPARPFLPCPSRAGLMTDTPADGPRVSLFVTCLIDAMRSGIGFAAIQLLEEAGCSVGCRGRRPVAASPPSTGTRRRPRPATRR